MRQDRLAFQGSGATIAADSVKRQAVNTREDRIRRRAYELWQQAGQSGTPEDHWLRAERELKDAADRPEATIEDAGPAEAVAAVEAITSGGQGEAPAPAKAPSKPRAPRKAAQKPAAPKKRS
jgi:Protein of unknown function (DUF2934)